MKITNQKQMPDGSGAIGLNEGWDIEASDTPNSKGGLRKWFIDALSAAGLAGLGMKGLDNMQASSQVEAKPVPISFETDSEAAAAATVSPEVAAILARVKAENAAKNEQRIVNAETISGIDERIEQEQATGEQLDTTIEVLNEIKDEL